MSPRYRWIKLFNIAFAISIAVVYAVLIVMYYTTPPKYREPLSFWQIIGSILLPIPMYLFCFLIVGIGFAQRQYPVQLELEDLKEQQAKANPKSTSHDYPGVTVIPDYSMPADGPGTYRIQGVNRENKMDATLNILADSAANAKVKAELDGIVVTTVTRIA